jgi:DNA-binding transcriptional LysR family regulator
VAVLPVRSPLASADPLRLGDLHDEDFVLFPHASTPQFHDELVGACRQAGFTPRVAHECSAMPTVVALVAAGLGVSLVPQSISKIDVDTVVYRELRGIQPEARIAMVIPTTNNRPLVRNFADIVKSGL